MNLATGGQYKGSLNGLELDGVDIWDNLIQNTPTSRSEMVFLSYATLQFSMQVNDVKYIHYYETDDRDFPATVFLRDLNPLESKTICSSPSLITLGFKQYSQLMGSSDSSSSASTLKQFAVVFVLVFLSAIITGLAVVLIFQSQNSNRRQETQAILTVGSGKDANVDGMSYQRMRVEA